MDQIKNSAPLAAQQFHTKTELDNSDLNNYPLRNIVRSQYEHFSVYSPFGLSVPLSVAVGCQKPK